MHQMLNAFPSLLVCTHPLANPPLGILPHVHKGLLGPFWVLGPILIPKFTSIHLTIIWGDCSGHALNADVSKSQHSRTGQWVVRIPLRTNFVDNKAA